MNRLSMMSMGALLALGSMASVAHADEAPKYKRLCGTVGAERLAQTADDDVAFAVELNDTPLSAEFQFLVYDSVDRHSKALRSLPKGAKICVYGTVQKGKGGSKALLIRVAGIE